MSQSDTRAQSETLGTILMVGVIITSITIAGGAATVSYLNQASTNQPLAELQIESDDGRSIHIQHAGGEALDTENTVVVIDDLTLGTVENVGSFDGNQDGLFSTGESITINPSASRGTVDVFIVDEITNSVVERKEITLVDGEESDLSVENFNVPGAAEQGETITVSADIVHSGEAQVTQDVDFTVNGKITDTKQVALRRGSQNVAFSYTVAEGEGANSISVEIATEADAESAEVAVLEVGELTIENLNVPEDAEQGETITVSADITHSGDIELTQNVDFSVNGERADTEKVTLNDGSQNIAFPYTVAESEEANSITVEIATKEDTESADIAISTAQKVFYVSGSAESSNGFLTTTNSILDFELKNSYQDEIEITGFETTGPAGAEGVDSISEEITVDTRDEFVRDRGYFPIGDRADLDSNAIIRPGSTASVTIREYRENDGIFNRVNISGEELTVTVYYIDPNGEEQTVDLTFVVDTV